MSKKTNPIGELSKIYSGQPPLQALLKLLPGWSSADALLQARALELRTERIRAFFDELAKGDIVLTEDLVRNDDFLHCFFKTAKAAMNTRRKEKIRMFARLLKGILTAKFSDADEYEEYLCILDDLSFRELRILAILRKYQYPEHPGENDLQRAMRYWNSFTANLEKIGIPKVEINSILTRLNRTGCYETIAGTYMDYKGDMGKMTPTYLKLESIIKDLDDRYAGEEFARGNLT